jgi:cytochrome o ubiquinol oxidase subunit II
VRSVTQSEFDSWASAARTEGTALDASAYRLLLRQTQNVTPYTYRTVQAGLFDAILTQQLPPGEGPVVLGAEK